MADHQFACDDLDVLLADDVPDIATDPAYLWPPRPGLIWPGTFPVARVRPAAGDISATSH